MRVEPEVGPARARVGDGVRVPVPLARGRVVEGDVDARPLPGVDADLVGVEGALGVHPRGGEPEQELEGEEGAREAAGNASE